jgi:hypothetical protein
MFMATLTTFNKMVQGYTDAVVPVDELTEASPLFATSEWGPTNNGFSQKYQVAQDIISASAVDLNSVYPKIGANWKLKDRDIAMFAGTREVHVNTVDQMAGGSLDAYLDDEMPLIGKETLSNISFDFYYGTSIPFAVSTGKLIDASNGSASGNKYSSIHVIRWEKGQFQGLYNKNWAEAKGGVFKATKLSGGDRYKSDTGESVYGVDIEMPLGFLPANSKNISVVGNIDLATISDEVLGELLMDALIDARAGSGGMTRVYAGPKTVARIGNLKEAQSLGVQNSRFWSVMFAGVEIIADWNIIEGKEAPITVA